MDIISEKLDDVNNLPDFLVDMMNEYIIYYKHIHNKDGNVTMFDNINIDDKLSTNQQLEGFYEAKCKYDLYENTNKEQTNIYTPSDFIDNGTSEMFGIRKNNKLIYISVSLFAILIEIVNLNREKNDDSTYEIIPLRRE